jgi:hypothetical protein
MTAARLRAVPAACGLLILLGAAPPAGAGSSAPQETGVAPERSAASTGILEITFLSAGDDGQAPAALALAAEPKIRLGRRDPIPVMSDLAFVVLCTTADHVPDHWDTRTPLAGAPRHEVVLFRPGSEPLPGRKPPMLALRHDAIYRVDLQPGTHNVVVGAAGKAVRTGEWRLIASDGARVTIEAGMTTRLEVRAHTGKGGVTARYVPENVWTIAVAGGPTPERPADSATTPSPSPTP